MGVNSPALLSFHMGSAKFLRQLERASDQAMQAAVGSCGGRVLKVPMVTATKLINACQMDEHGRGNNPN